MTIDSMLEQIESYYGEYENRKLKAMVRAYLIKDHKPELFKEVLRCILYYHKSKFGAPCIASIEDSIKKSRLEKGQVDTHKSKTTDTSIYQDYKKEKLAIPEEEKEANKTKLTSMFKSAVKRVGE